jgi:hypothetical protein
MVVDKRVVAGVNKQPGKVDGPAVAFDEVIQSLTKSGFAVDIISS